MTPGSLVAREARRRGSEHPRQLGEAVRWAPEITGGDRPRDVREAERFERRRVRVRHGSVHRGGPGPTPVLRLPFWSWSRSGGSLTGRRGLMDAAGAGSVERRRDARQEGTGAVAGRGRRGLPSGRPGRHRVRAARAGPFGTRRGRGPRAGPGGNARAHNGLQVSTLPEYRDRYALYRTDEDLQAAHAAFPPTSPGTTTRHRTTTPTSSPRSGRPPRPLSGDGSPLTRPTTSTCP